MNKQSILALLHEKGISYTMAEHAPVYSIDEMMLLNLPYPESVAKNLFVRDDKKRGYYLITVREEKRVDLKAFAVEHGLRKLSFASEEDLAALLGLTKGSVTPFGLLNDAACKVKFFLDRDFDGRQLGIHPNDNTATVWLAASDLMDILREHGTEMELVSIQ